MQKSAFLLLAIITVSSCGPSAEQKAKEAKLKQDSIVKAAEEAVRLRLERKHLLQDSIEVFELEIEATQNRMIVLTGDLEAARDKMTTIKGYQFLRSATEREEQIKNQSMVIQNLEIELNALHEQVFTKQETRDRWRQELSQLN